MIRADHFHNQPCPTDPPGGPPGETSSPPLYEYSYLGPRLRLGLLHLPPLRQPLVMHSRR